MLSNLNFMKILKYLLLLVLILIVIGAIYLATLDGKYEVSRSRIINAEPELVFNELNDYKNWEAWGPWYEQDSTIQETYASNTVGEGASYSWTGKDGKGMMKTVSVDKPNRIDQEVVFETPFGDMLSENDWILEKVDGGTKLSWTMKGELGFFSRFMAGGMEEMMGPMEERGLELLDQTIQKKIKEFSITYNGIVDYSGGFFLFTTTSSSIDEIGAKYPLMMLKVNTFINSNNVRTTGSPFTIYHKYDEQGGTAMYSVCYPISEKMITPIGSDIVSGFMNRGMYFKTTLKGGYENSEKAWTEAYDEAAKLPDYDIDEKGEPFEIYVNAPMNTPNPADLITEIYIPVKENAISLTE